MYGFGYPNVFEPHDEKTCILHLRKNKRADQLHGNSAAGQCLCFRYIDNTIPLLPKFEISSLWPSSEALKPGLCWTWSETLKTGFLVTQLILASS